MLNVNVINAKNTQKVEVKPGQSANLKVDSNTRFELVDSASGKAPAQIKARRVGDNLEIVTDEKAQIEDEALSNAQKPDLVLENYYKQADVSLFAGAGEEAVSYVPVDGAASSSYAAMNTSATTGAALGVLPLLNPLLGAAVVGAGAVVATTGNDTATSNQIPVAQDAATKVTENKVVSDKVPTATDADGTVASYRLVSDVAAGKLTFNADGSYSFDANKDFDSLADGQTKTVSFTYSAVDNAGGVSEPKTVTITVAGVNDAATISGTGTGAVTEDVASANMASGTLAVSDVDTGQALFEAPASLVGTYGTYTFNASSGAWTYTLDNTKGTVQALTAGQNVVDHLVVKSLDGTGSKSIDVTITGANDAPEIRLVGSDSKNLVFQETNDVLIANRTMSITDQDLNDGFTAQVVGLTFDGTTAFDVSKYSPQQLQDTTTYFRSAYWFGVMSVEKVNTDHNLKWGFTSRSATNADWLGEGETLVLNYTIQIKDKSGAEASQVVTVKIIGTNDAPVAMEYNYDVNEGDLLNDHVFAFDPEDNPLKYSLVGAAPAGLSFNDDGTYSFDAGNAAYDSLLEGETKDVIFKFMANDGKVNSNEGTSTITITGANDAATISGTATGEVTEDAASANVALGKLAVIDVDTGQALFEEPASLEGTYGTYTFNASSGAWTYTLDNTKGTVQALAVGQNVVDHLVVKSLDGTGSKSIDVTITGVNDAPVASVATQFVDEGKTVTGAVTAADADEGATLSYALVGAAPAGLSFKNDGTYSFDASDAAYDSLKAGETKDLAVKFKANDGTVDSAEQTLTITVKGTNDAPVATYVMAQTATEDDVKVVGQLTLSDVDKDATATYAVDGAAIAGLTINTNGSWSFDPKHAAYQSLAAGQEQEITVTYKVTDDQGASDTESFTITVTGTNDAATINGTTTGGVTEDAKANTVAGRLTVSDVDAGQTKVVAQTDQAGTFGKFSITEAGNWTYTLDNSKVKVQALKADETVTETFSVKSADGTASQDVVVTITGANDAATISGTTTGGVTEDAKANTAAGTLTVSDADAGQTKVVAQTDQAGTFGKFSITEAGNWTYTLDNSKANVQALKADETVTETFSVKSADSTASQDVVVTITGANDAAKILMNDGDTKSADLLETNVILSTSGTLTVADPDAGDVCSAHVADVNFDGSTAFDPTALSPVDLSNFKAFVLNWLSVSEINDPSTSHNLSWSFNSTKNSYLDWLEAGEKLVLNYTIEVQDTSGEKVSEVVSVTIDGSDDVPEISIVGTDTDSVDVAEDPLQVDAIGTITVNYGDISESAQLVVSGVKVNLAKSQFPLPLTADEVNALEAALLGKLQLLADSTTPDGLHNVQWSLDLGGLLPKGAVLVLDYTLDLKSSDNTVAFDQQVISISITGKNDAPVIQLTGIDLDQVVLTESNQILSASGTLTVTDPDYNDSIVSFEVIDVQLDPTVPSFLTLEQFASVQSALKSFLTLSAVGTTADLHNLEWTFDSAYDNNLDLIPEGATLALKYTIEVKDTAGTNTSHAVTVKINGTNDGLAIQVQPGDTDRADLFETNPALSASGTVSLFDMDLTDEVNYVVSDVALNTTVTPFLSADDFAIIKEQVKGFMTLDAIGYLNDVHNLQWTFDATGDSHSGFIPAGQTLALDYTVTATDKSGEIATQVIHINIRGTNAIPLIEFKGTDSAAESLIETDDVLSTTGTMSLTDLDFNDPANATRISVKLTGSHGGFDDNYFLGMLKLSTETDQNGDPLRVNEPHNVRWTFESLAQDDFDYLAKDEVLKLEYTIEVKDSVGATSQQVIAVSITGTNDAPQVFVWDGDSASGSILSPTQDVTGSLSIFDEDVVTAYFAGVKFDGVQITDAALKLNLYSLFVIDQTSTYKTVNEPNNFDWSFKTADAFAKGLASGLSAGAHQLTYTMDFMDTYSAEHKQDINILFTV